MNAFWFNLKNCVRFKNAAICSVLFYLFMILPAGAENSSVNISARIDFGINLFSPHVKTDALDFQAVKKILDSDSKNLPLHAYALSAYINEITGGTKSINESSIEIEKLLSYVLLRFDPQRSTTYFDRGYLYMLIACLGYQNYNGRAFALMALCDMAALIQMEPLNAYYHMFYTVVYASLKDHDIADFRLYDPLEELKKALSFEITDPQFHYIVGSTFLAISQNSPDIHQLAYAEFMQAVRLAPKNNILKEKVFKNLIDLLAEYGERKLQKPFWLEESAYAYLIEKDQDSAAAHNNLGFLYTMSNVKLDVALEHCKKAVSLDPNNPVYLDSLGCAYYKNRDIKKSLETLRKAYSMNPELKEVHEHLSEIYLQLNDNASAIKHLEFLLSLDTKNALINNNYGYVLCEANQKIDKAIEHCKVAVEAEPTNSVYLDSLAWAYFKNNMMKQAKETLGRAIKADPTLGALYIHKGDMLFYEDSIDEALECYSRGMALDPVFPFASDNFSYLNAIKITRAKLSAAQKNFPKVSDAACRDANGKQRPFTYEDYPLYFHKLFETMGFAPAKAEDIKLKNYMLDFIKNDDKALKADPVKKENDKKEDQKLLNDGEPIDENIMRFMNKTGEIIFTKETLEVILKTTGETSIQNAAPSSVETLIKSSVEVEIKK